MHYWLLLLPGHLVNVLLLAHRIEIVLVFDVVSAYLGELSVGDLAVSVAVRETDENVDLEGSQVNEFAALQGSLALLN